MYAVAHQCTAIGVDSLHVGEYAQRRGFSEDFEVNFNGQWGRASVSTCEATKERVGSVQVVSG